ncbi:MAG: hypothetical protein JW819_00370, partial [Candidatus Krumholzibacteriota bacterium]|nr:hypothetical protein [Candidatus Krumholzibacteriota bacterium]
MSKGTRKSTGLVLAAGILALLAVAATAGEARLYQAGDPPRALGAGGAAGCRAVGVDWDWWDWDIDWNWSWNDDRDDEWNDDWDDGWDDEWDDEWD